MLKLLKSLLQKTNPIQPTDPTEATIPKIGDYRIIEDGNGDFFIQMFVSMSIVQYWRNIADAKSLSIARDKLKGIKESDAYFARCHEIKSTYYE